MLKTSEIQKDVKPMKGMPDVGRTHSKQFQADFLKEIKTFL